MLRSDQVFAVTKPYPKMSVIHLGDLTINKNLSTILIDGAEVSLEPKLMELLLLFCDQQQKIVSRQDILSAIWPNSIVTDNAVNKLVAGLRKVLKDDPKNPKYIQTVPKRGYRLLFAAVEFNGTEKQTTKLQQALVEQESNTKLQSSSNDLNLEQSDINATLNTTTQTKAEKSKPKLVMLISLTVLVIIAYVSLLWRPSTTEATFDAPKPTKLTVKELTRMQGLERSPLMSPGQEFILFLRENPNTGHRSLWHKNLNNEQTTQISEITPYVSRIIAVNKKVDDWQLIYLSQEDGQCQVDTATLMNSTHLVDNKTLFNCDGSRLHDAAYDVKQQKLYYSSSNDHESHTQIYQFDVENKSHSLITQPEIIGMGNRGIDLSPDGKKLLIVQLDKNFNSRVFVLNLQNNRLETALNTEHNIEKATWTHDSKHIMYFDSFPARQIIKSDLQGTNRQTLLTVSEYVETEFSRIEGSQDIIFSTMNMDFNNRWVNHVDKVKELSNSTVYDMQPTLAHNALKYAFVSTRTGKEQLYFGDLTTGSSRVISRLDEYRWLKKLSFSPNDKYLLTADTGHIWLINVKELLASGNLIDISPQSSIVKTEGALLTAIWLNNQFLYYKTREKGLIKGFIYDRQLNHSVEVDERWQTILTDHRFADTLYMVDPVDTQIYQMPMANLIFNRTQSKIKFPETSVTTTGTRLSKSYIDLKLHDGKVYYVTASNTGNARPYDFQIEVKPINSDNKGEIEIYKTSCSCGFDVADSGFMVSELTEIEGDIYRTKH